MAENFDLLNMRHAANFCLYNTVHVTLSHPGSQEKASVLSSRVYMPEEKSFSKKHMLQSLDMCHTSDVKKLRYLMLWEISIGLKVLVLEDSVVDKKHQDTMSILQEWMHILPEQSSIHWHFECANNYVQSTAEADVNIIGFGGIWP